VFNVSKSKEDVKEEILRSIGLSKENLEFYKKLYADRNLMNQPDKTEK